MNVFNAIAWTLVWFVVLDMSNWVRLSAGKEEKEYPDEAHQVAGLLWLAGVAICLFFTK